MLVKLAEVSDYFFTLESAPALQVLKPGIGSADIFIACLGLSEVRFKIRRDLLTLALRFLHVFLLFHEVDARDSSEDGLYNRNVDRERGQVV